MLSKSAWNYAQKRIRQERSDRQKVLHEHQWQPMETAPKDQFVDIWDSSISERLADCRFCTPYNVRGDHPVWCNWGIVDYDGIQDWVRIPTPSYWMPVPKPPKENTNV